MVFGQYLVLYGLLIFVSLQYVKISLETNKEYFPKQSLWSIEPTDDD
jgi:hypothetical protein